MHHSNAISAVLAVIVCGLLTGCQAQPTEPSVPAAPSLVPVARSSQSTAVAEQRPGYGRPTGTSNVCDRLSELSELRQLGERFRQLAQPQHAHAAAARIRLAAKALRGLRADAGATLRDSLTGTAAALDRVAGAGITDTVAVDLVSRRLTALGEEVQLTCGYTLG